MIQTQPVDYDQAADEYALYRRVHTGVFSELCQQGGFGPDSVVLEVGCGPGTYISLLASRFRCTACGLDPSPRMLAHARTRRDRVTWLLGRGEQLPFAGDIFDLVFAVDVIHHLADKAAFYREAARTLKQGGHLCTVTDSADIIHSREILSGYFPETVEHELTRYPRIVQLQAWMTVAGLTGFETAIVKEPYQITSSQPFRHKAYSSLYLISDEEWRIGLQRLERDLDQGPIPGMALYVCVWGHKPGG